MRWLILAILILSFGGLPASASTAIQGLGGFFLVSDEFGNARVSGSSITLVNDTPNGVVVRDDRVRHAQKGHLWAATAENTLSTVEIGLLWIVNLSTNTRNLTLDAIFLNSPDNIGINYRFYINPVVTSSGTLLLIGNNNTAFAPNPAGAQAFQEPTTTSFGIKLLELTTSDSLIFEANQRLILVPGTSLLVTGVATGANRDYGVTIGWVEPFNP